MKAGETGKVAKKKQTMDKKHMLDRIELNIPGQGSMYIYSGPKNDQSPEKGGSWGAAWNDSDKVTWYILGGNYEDANIPKSDLDYVALIALGLPKASIAHIAKFINIPMKEMANVVNLSIKTLERKKPEDPMDKVVSSQAIEIAGTLAHGMEVFEDREKLNRWLSKENRALGGKRPIELLGTPTGIKLVNNILTRIEEGVFS